MLLNKMNYLKSNSNIFFQQNRKEEKNKILGFWIYLMSDCIIFSILFLVYNILYILNIENSKIEYNLFFVFLETIILLLSSFVYGFIISQIKYKKINNIIILLFLTFLLGSCFIFLEIYEMYYLLLKNLFPQNNAFFSAYYTLLGTHAIHVIIGLLWILILILQIFYYGIDHTLKVRIICLGMFWHFLDIIWIVVFNNVYLLGSMK